jgi:hypothetical protein
MQNQLLDKVNSKINIDNRAICDISSKNLMLIPMLIPNEQRIRDADKVNDIIQYQQTMLRDKGRCNFIGTINIHFCDETQEFYLVDGQHRYEAIKHINRTNNINIIIELVMVHTLDELRKNYQIVNMNTPLPEFPETIDKNIPEEVALYFKNEYPHMWSKNSRARRPNIHFNYFQEALGVLTYKLQLKSTQDLLKIVADYNNRLSNWDYSQFPDNKNLNEGMIQKCIDNSMFLGLYRHVSDEFRYEWVREIVKFNTGEDMKRTHGKNLNTKACISKALKTCIWDTNIGKNIRAALCICCDNNEIKVENFHAGHIMAESNGGNTDQNNLLPICATCNTSMGSTHMNDFVKNNFPNHYANFLKRKYTSIIKPKRGGILGLFR